jgi:predicted phage terminase large subunit-like protein
MKKNNDSDVLRLFRTVLDVGAQLQRLICERSLPDYMREAWPILNPATPLIFNWHIDLIAEYLLACILGQIHRLIINVPPKSSKSTLVSVMWPTWCWGPLNRPGTRWMFASYSERVSTRDSLARRTLLTSQWYLNHWGPRVKLIADQNQKTIFQNTARGHMLATTMGGQGTGLGGQILVIDDPHDTEKIISEKERQRGLHNFDHKLCTRLDDRKSGAIVAVMQRLHTKDLSGHLLEGAGGERWEHLCIPMEAPARKVYIFPVSNKEYVREEGELLNPVREGPAEIEEHKERLGSLGYAGQFQQRPVPEGGAIFKSSYLKFWPEDKDRDVELPRVIRIVQSWDCAIKTSETNSYSVCTTWFELDDRFLLRHVWRKHVEFPEMLHAMHELAAQFHPDCILVEDKASGQSAIQELRRSRLPVIALNVDSDKTARARAAAPTAEAGKIWIMRDASWARLYIDELCNFPKSEFTDQVDSTTQFINWAKGSLGWSRVRREEDERFRREQIARGLPVRYDDNGQPVFVCAYTGCEKELGTTIHEARGLKFCSLVHSF